VRRAVTAAAARKPIVVGLRSSDLNEGAIDLGALGQDAGVIVKRAK
jgi:hypothetical protein